MKYLVNLAVIALWIGLLAAGGPAAAAPGSPASPSPTTAPSPTATPSPKGPTAAVEIRERWEARANADFNAALFDDTSVMLQRYRVGLSVPAGALTVYIQPQLVRAVATNQEVDADLHQGYAEWAPWTGAKVRLGRQELVLGDSRLIGNGDWNMQGRAWDGARVWWASPQSRVDLFGGRLEKFQALPAGADPHLFGLYATQTPVKGLTWDEYVLLKTQGQAGAGNGDVARWTAGGRMAWTAGPWTLKGEAAWQFGQDGTADISAWASAWTAGYGIVAPWSPRLEAEYDVASGDASTTDATNGTFDQLFPTNHRNYGIADYVGWRNVNVWRFGTGATPWKGAALQIEYLSFQLAQPRDAWYGDNGVAILRDATGASGSDIGSEWDAYLKTPVNTQTAVDMGFAHFSPGALVQRVRGRADASDWWYLQWTQKF